MKGRVRPSLVGLLQSVAVASYCALVGAFMFYISRTAVQPGYLGIFLMLVLLVFSAAVTGTLVFRANSAVIRLLSEYFRKPKANVKIVSSPYSKEKIVEIP